MRVVVSRVEVLAAVLNTAVLREYCRGVVVVGAVVLVATVSITRVRGGVSGECRICVCRVKGCCCEGCDVGGCGIRMMIDDGGIGGMKDLSQRIAPW